MKLWLWIVVISAVGCLSLDTINHDNKTYQKIDTIVFQYTIKFQYTDNRTSQSIFEKQSLARSYEWTIYCNSKLPSENYRTICFNPWAPDSEWVSPSCDCFVIPHTTLAQLHNVGNSEYVRPFPFGFPPNRQLDCRPFIKDGPRLCTITESKYTANITKWSSDDNEYGPSVDEHLKGMCGNMINGWIPYLLDTPIELSSVCDNYTQNPDIQECSCNRDGNCQFIFGPTQNVPYSLNKMGNWSLSVQNCQKDGENASCPYSFVLPAEKLIVRVHSTTLGMFWDIAAPLSYDECILPYDKLGWTSKHLSLRHAVRHILGHAYSRVYPSTNPP